MEENEDAEVVEETTSGKEKVTHDFSRSATGFVFGYIGSKVGERLYDVALKAIRQKRLAKLKG